MDWGFLLEQLGYLCDDNSFPMLLSYYTGVVMERVTPSIRAASPNSWGDAQPGTELRGHLQIFGREAEAFGIEGWLRMHDADPQRWAEAADGWRRLGADYVMLYPMYRIPDVDAQIETLRRFKDVADG